MSTRLILVLWALALAACGPGGGGPGGAAAAGNDASLTALEITDVDLLPAFHTAVTTYTADVGVFATTVRVRPTAADSGATILVDGTSVASGSSSDPIELPLGASDIEVTITAGDGITTSTYTTTVTRAAGAAIESYIKAHNTDSLDQFGISVAISGDTMVVGALAEANGATGVNTTGAGNSAPLSGAAYVFVRNGTTWSQEAYLKPSNTDATDIFGRSVAIAGDTLVVGAPFEDSAATGVNGNDADNSALTSGAAYVFVRNGTTWSQQAYLKASNTTAGDMFGEAVAISGNTIVVGAKNEGSNATGVNGNENDESETESGAAYVFGRSGTTWTQRAYLKASNTDMDDHFGSSVAIAGDTIAVGAFQEDSSSTGVGGNQTNDMAMDAGSAYVFVRNAGTWSQQAYIKASNTETGDWFGYSVALSSDTLVVSAREEDSNANDVNGNENDNAASNSGAAYVFVRTGTTWTQEAYLKGQDADSEDRFGGTVAISGNTIVVGASDEDSNATGVDGDHLNDLAIGSGAAYVFARSGVTWTRRAYLKASNTDPGDRFGFAVALSGDTIVVGADQEASILTGIDPNPVSNAAPLAGAVYVFR